MGNDSMNGLSISKDNFEKLPVEAKLDVIFDCLEEISGKLKRSRKIDTAVSGVTGFLGGALTIISNWFFFKG